MICNNLANTVSDYSAIQIAVELKQTQSNGKDYRRNQMMLRRTSE